MIDKIGLSMLPVGDYQLRIKTVMRRGSHLYYTAEFLDGSMEGQELKWRVF